MIEKHKEYLHVGLQRLGVQLADEGQVLDQLMVYMAELKKWNRKVNLVSRESTDEQILENHFLDSLTLVPLLRPNRDAAAVSLLDVGSGAGFPGLVVKVASPSLPITLVEPRQKRAFFLKQMVRVLGLAEVKVVTARLEEESGSGGLGNRLYRWITCRGLTDMVSFLAMARCHLQPAGQVVCMKGPAGEDELQALQHQVKATGFCLQQRLHLQLPYTRADRQLFVFGAVL